MTRKESLISDPQVVRQPETYSSGSRLLVICVQCQNHVELTVNSYWRRRHDGQPWVCSACLKPEIASKAKLNPLYSDPAYRAKFAALHDDPDYHARVHNQTVYTKISQGSKAAWQDEGKRTNHLAHRDTDEFKAHCKAVGTASWEAMREQSVADRSESFLAKATALHGSRFDYSAVQYETTLTPVSVICAECNHEYKQLPITHMRGSTCPNCSQSSGQHELYQFLQQYESCVLGDRQVIGPAEIDVYVDRCKLGVEYHGAFWHSYCQLETKQQRFRHQNKALSASGKGVQLLQFYDYEWEEQRSLVESMILHRLGRSRRIMARQLKIDVIDHATAESFFSVNHLAGYRASQLTVALRDNTGVLMAASFTRDKVSNTSEIIRMATKQGWCVTGGLSRILCAARKLFPGPIHTFADMRYSTGLGYDRAGFRQTGITEPGYLYWKCGRRYCRQRCQKHKLREFLGEGFNPELSEAQNMFNNGFRRCWNAGNLRLVMG